MILIIPIVILVIVAMCAILDIEKKMDKIINLMQGLPIDHKASKKKDKEKK